MLNKVEEAGTSKTTFFDLLGGEAGGTENIRKLVETFYDIMDSDPKAAPIRAMHQADLTSAREKLFMFLTGWTGGPQLYIERYGHPMLRKRHLPFAIDESARDQWMYCMIKAMHQLAYEDLLMKRLAEQLYGVADFMRNQ
ncbi:group II truncated hemoglobin [Methylotenera sp.]|uniref:group II truncated hemoglobin n=1 Tax=Methylotenera sp. TaxID=2051956 RepID=UPI0027319DB3|nr:group II truncated hemoglobin [Methylotenera sp.]MDP2072030.1 group II truncated hemoglobin [Methylotenera sp.]MDP2230615.1 group II truncated hemoglobin [Methylotenera sp.]MDP3006961.1 group II truncated hemoglobin [Methylotenera sp.]MDP3007102.1 group II truncated hemoglobin [Methylotenera sp.]MDP3140691.1 group II truncated hemoglobin [Methylotenera sp.]